MSKTLIRFLLCASVLGGGLSGLSVPVQAMDDMMMQKNSVRQSMSNSLRDAIATGVRTHPEYNAVRASRRATDFELRQGKALFLPSVDVRADAGLEHTNDSGTRARVGDDEDLLRSQATITLTQMLFDGFDAKHEVERQKARVVSSAHRVAETKEFVGLSIVESYLNVLRQRYLSQISLGNVNDHVKILQQIEEGVSAGRSTQADLEQARARLAAAQATRASVLESLEVAESQYYRNVGDEPGALIMPSVPYSALRSSLENEVTYGLANSPTLNIYESDIEVAFAEAEGVRAAYYPNVDLELSANYADDIAGVETYEKNASALLRMDWNLYRGGADVAREHEFRYRHEQAKASYAQASRSLEDEIRQTWAGMIAAGARAEEYAHQAAANEEVVKAYKDQFNLSRRTLLDVLDAQNELYVSKTSKINSEFVQMFSVYRLLALRGELMATLGVDDPDASAVSTANAEWAEKDKLKAR